MNIAKYEKVIQWAVIGAGAYVVLSIYSKGIGGTVKDLTGGIITGVIDGTAGAIAGAYEAIPDPVKPSSDQNIFYKGVNGIGGALTGDENFTLGGWIYDKTH